MVQHDIVESAVAVVRDDGITQPVLLRISGSYYIKDDHTATLITDCSCFAFWKPSFSRRQTFTILEPFSTIYLGNILARH